LREQLRERRLMRGEFRRVVNDVLGRRIGGRIVRVVRRRPELLVVNVAATTETNARSAAWFAPARPSIVGSTSTWLVNALIVRGSGNIFGFEMMSGTWIDSSYAWYHF